MILGLLGHDLPSPKILLIVLAAFVVLFLLARFGFFNGMNSGGGRDPGGSGRSWQCQRCGTWFQPEKVETTSTGQERHWVDERCPHCGWDKDFKDHNHDGRPDQYE